MCDGHPLGNFNIYDMHCDPLDGATDRAMDSENKAPLRDPIMCARSLELMMGCSQCTTSLSSLRSLERSIRGLNDPSPVQIGDEQMTPDRMEENHRQTTKLICEVE